MSDTLRFTVDVRLPFGVEGSISPGETWILREMHLLIHVHSRKRLSATTRYLSTIHRNTRGKLDVTRSVDTQYPVIDNFSIVFRIFNEKKNRCNMQLCR